MLISILSFTCFGDEGGSFAGGRVIFTGSVDFLDRPVVLLTVDAIAVGGAFPFEGFLTAVASRLSASNSRSRRNLNTHKSMTGHVTIIAKADWLINSYFLSD